MQVIISTRGMTVSRTYKDELTRKLAKIEPMVPAGSFLQASSTTSMS